MSSSAPWVLLALAAAGGLIYLLQPVLGPFLFAALLAYLGDPLADRLEARGLGRTGAVVLVFLALSLVLTLGLLGFLPLLVEQLRDLLQRLLDGIETFPDGFNMIFTGGNVGKLMIKV